MKITRKPVIVITDPRWAQETYCMFDDQSPEEMWGDTWVQERAQAINDQNSEFDVFDDVNLEQVREMMEEEFYAENNTVDVVLKNHNILGTNETRRNGFDWYEFEPDGRCTYLTTGTIRELAEYLR